jgi:hypothetical protein
MDSVEYKECLERIERLKKVKNKKEIINLLIKANILTKKGNFKKFFK